MSVPLGHSIDAVGRANLFEAVERAARQVGLAMFVVDVHASPPTIAYASELLAHLVGRRRDDIVGRPAWELVAPEEQDRVREVIASRGPGAPPLSMEVEILRPDGSRRSIEVGVARVAMAAAERAVCYFRDATEERAAVGALRRSEARFRSLVEKAPDGVVIVVRGRVVLMNAAAARMLGAAERVRGRPSPTSSCPRTRRARAHGADRAWRGARAVRVSPPRRRRARRRGPLEPVRVGR
jgi:PAS domain S-box-containing protein